MERKRIIYGLESYSPFKPVVWISSYETATNQSLPSLEVCIDSQEYALIVWIGSYEWEPTTNQYPSGPNLWISIDELPKVHLDLKYWLVVRWNTNQLLIINYNWSGYT